MLSLLRHWKRQISALLVRFAAKPYANTTLLIHSFADSSFLPISIDLTLIPISLSAPKRSFIFAFWSAIGSILGGIFAYFIGIKLMSTLGLSIVSLYGAEDSWNMTIETFRGEYAVWTLIVAALTPIPFALATMASGVVKMDFTTFLIISSVSRTIRFLVLALLIYYFGDAVQVFLDKYSRLIAIAVTGITVFFTSFILFFN
ncbi:MAG: VTT domain-containing protein [Candidatus Kapaibacterium sp.]|nr:VTT domain-containing protein [Candidatus Kapabacteria bacterium]